MTPLGPFLVLALTCVGALAASFDRLRADRALVAARLGFRVEGVPLPLPRAGTVRSVAERCRARLGRSRRRAAAGEGLIDVCVEVAAGVRSGGSITRGLERAAGRVEADLARRLGAVLAGVEAGVPLDRGLERWADVTDDPDVRLVAAVISLQRRTGGDLPSMLDRVAETLRDRIAATAEVASLTAQARLSGIVVGLLPIGFFAFLSLVSPGEMLSVVSSPLGALLIGVGLSLELLAFFAIRHILRGGA